PVSTMCISKRIMAVLFCLLSVAGFGLCAAGIVGVWVIKQPVQDRTTQIIDRADRALEVTGQTLAQAHASLRKARNDLKAIQLVTSSSGDRKEKPGFVHNMFARVLAKRLGPNVGRVHDQITQVAEGSIVLNSLLEGMQQLPITSVRALDTEQLTDIRQSLT